MFQALLSFTGFRLVRQANSRDVPLAKPQRNYSKDAEAAIEQTPPEGNAANCPKDKSVRNDERAGYHAKCEEPAIADWITQRSDEGNSNHKMAKREPIGAI